MSKHWRLDGYDGLVAAQLFRLGCSVSSVAHKMLVDRTVVARFAQKLASLQVALPTTALRNSRAIKTRAAKTRARAATWNLIS